MKTILGLLLAGVMIIFFSIIIVISFITCILLFKEQFTHDSSIITNHSVGWFIIMISIVMGVGGGASLVCLNRMVSYRLMNLPKLSLPDPQKF